MSHHLYTMCMGVNQPQYPRWSAYKDWKASASLRLCRHPFLNGWPCGPVTRQAHRDGKCRLDSCLPHGAQKRGKGEKEIGETYVSPQWHKHSSLDLISHSLHSPNSTAWASFFDGFIKINAVWRGSCRELICKQDCSLYRYLFPWLVERTRLDLNICHYVIIRFQF